MKINVEKNLNASPDEGRSFWQRKVDLGNLGDITIGKAEFEQAWSWEKCVKPLAKTDICQASHIRYVIAGRMKVVMDDGTEVKGAPGDTAIIPPGHNAWVVGDEPCIMIDSTGLKDYPKKQEWINW